MVDEPRKRSRFDQTEPNKPSRFDRRSRSPPSEPRTTTTTARSRSPIESKSPATRDAKDPAAAAAAAAARINAQIQARRAELPPAQPVVVAPKKSINAVEIADEIYTQDGDYIKDIEINDLRNKYTLTKGSTQKLIKDETGADVTTRGEYFPDKSMATPTNPPLYLHITSTTKEGLEKALQKIDELMSQELPNLIDERRFKRREPEQFERDEYGRRKWPEEKIPIDLEPIPGFNLRAQVVGAGGAYVKHIQGETRCRVQIKGRGSGFKDQHTGQEHDEPMYLHVAGPDAEMVKTAKELCIDLLANVKEEYERFKERGPQNRGNYGGDRNDRGDRGGYGDRGGRQDSYGGYNNGGHQNHNQVGYGGAQSPVEGQAGTPQDYAAQYAQYYGTTGAATAAGGAADPYAAYGGYEAYMQMYYQYYQQQQATSQSPSNAGASGAVPPPPPPPANDVPPPPPPSNNAPPPPPPGAGTYNAVPPPPGM